MAAPSKGTSVLASLTAEVMATKTKASGARLTPVEGEKGALPLEMAKLPNDVGVFMSNEALHDHAKQLRKFAGDAIAIADGLDGLLSESSTESAKADPDAERKAKEAEGDAKAKARETQKAQVTPVEEAQTTPPDGDNPSDVGTDEPTDFGAAYAAKQAAAQAAVFAPSGGWNCPIHHKAGVPKTSAKGRPFIGCPDCTQFYGG